VREGVRLSVGKTTRILDKGEKASHRYPFDPKIVTAYRRQSFNTYYKY